MGHFFISYSRKDQQFVEELKKRLNIAGLKSWIDAEELKAGRDWRDDIDNAIRQCDALIVVMSPSAKESEYVTYEWAFAWGIGLYVVPIILKETELHPRLKFLQYIDFTNPWPTPPWEKLIHRLEEILEERRVLDLSKNADKKYLLDIPNIASTPLLFERLGVQAVLLEGDGAFEYRNTKSPQTVQYSWDHTPYILKNLPDEVVDLCNRVLEERTKYAQDNYKPLYNGRLARLIDFQPLRDDKTGFRGMRLGLQETDYFTFLSTNHALESELASEVKKSSLFEIERRSVRNLRGSKLANGLTVSANVVIETENGLKYLLVQKRNLAKVTHSLSVWQCSAAGSINMPADTSTTYPNPFFSAVIREIKEETGIALDASEVVFLGLTRDTRYFEPALIAQATIKANPEAILQQIEDSFEAERFEIVRLTPDAFLQFLLRNGRDALKRKKKKTSHLNERELILAAIDDYAANALAAVVLTLLHEFGNVVTIERIFGVS